jgi:hypothetical protein
MIIVISPDIGDGSMPIIVVFFGMNIQLYMSYAEE